jgi:hypothetical protein
VSAQTQQRQQPIHRKESSDCECELEGITLQLIRQDIFGDAENSKDEDGHAAERHHFVGWIWSNVMHDRDDTVNDNICSENDEEEGDDT